MKALIIKPVSADCHKTLMMTIFEECQNGSSADVHILETDVADKIIENIIDAMQFVTAANFDTSMMRIPKTIRHLENNEPSLMELLSKREKEVLDLIVEGYSYKMIGDRLNIAMDTVRSHIKKIYEKLQVKSNVQAAAKALRSNAKTRISFEVDEIG